MLGSQKNCCRGTLFQGFATWNIPLKIIAAQVLLLIALVTFTVVTQLIA